MMTTGDVRRSELYTRISMVSLALGGRSRYSQRTIEPVHNIERTWRTGISMVG